MLDVGYHGGRPVARVDVVLLDTGVASNGEESCSGTVVADSRDAIRCWHSFIRYSLGADIPCAGLSVCHVLAWGHIEGV
jgi:hypothetical protein